MNYAIILAAGFGTRIKNLDIPKQYYEINDIPVIEKPKKNVKKKKKGTPGKVSIGSNKNDNNKNIRGSSKSINRSSTPIQNRKSTPTNSNIKIGNFGKFKKH